MRSSRALLVNALLGLTMVSCRRPAIQSGKYACEEDQDCLWGWTCRSQGGAPKTCQEPLPQTDGLVGAHDPDGRNGTPGSDAAFLCACPTPAEGKICIRGHVVDGLGYLTNTGSAPVVGDQLSFEVWDPIAMIAGGSGHPQYKGRVDAGGCFIAPSVTLPVSQALVIVVDDGAEHRFMRTANTFSLWPVPSILELTVPLLPSSAFNGLELSSKGTMLLYYRGVSGSGVAGISPTKENKELPWSGGTEVIFFADDITKPPYVLVGETGTRASGLAAVHQAPLSTYGGSRVGCTIAKSWGLSVPGQVNIVSLNVTGCSS